MKLLRNFLIYGVPAIVVIGGLLVAANMLSARKATRRNPGPSWSKATGRRKTRSLR